MTKHRRWILFSRIACRTTIVSALLILSFSGTASAWPPGGNGGGAGGGSDGGGGSSSPLAGVVYYAYSPDLIAMDADGSNKTSVVTGIGDAVPSLAKHHDQRWFLQGYNDLTVTNEDNETVSIYLPPNDVTISQRAWVNDPDFGPDTYISWYEPPVKGNGESMTAGTLVLAPVIYDANGDIVGLDMTLAESFFGVSWDFDWSPDGTAVAYRVDDQLWIYDTLSDQHVPLPPAISFEPRWSPDGSRIAYGAVYENLTTIETIDVNSLSIKVVAKARNHGINGSYVDRPNWSPTGEYILYRYLDANGFNWYYDIMRCTADGKSPTNLTNEVTLTFIHGVDILGWRAE